VTFLIGWRHVYSFLELEHVVSLVFSLARRRIAPVALGSKWWWRRRRYQL